MGDFFVRRLQACSHSSFFHEVLIFSFPLAAGKPLSRFPPNACRGERCGVWGRTAPIKPVRICQWLTFAPGTFSARTRRAFDFPRSNLLSNRCLFFERVKMTYAECERRRRTVQSSYRTYLRGKSKGSNGRVPSPPQGVPKLKRSGFSQSDQLESELACVALTGFDSP